MEKGDWIASKAPGNPRAALSRNVNEAITGLCICCLCGPPWWLHSHTGFHCHLKLPAGEATSSRHLSGGGQAAVLPVRRGRSAWWVEKALLLTVHLIPGVFSRQGPGPVPVTHWVEVLPLAKIDQLAISEAEWEIHQGWFSKEK